MKDKTSFIINKISQQGGSSEGSELYVVTDINTGLSEVVVETSVTQRFPIRDYDKTRGLYEDIIGDGFIITVEDIRKLRLTGKINLTNQ